MCGSLLFVSGCSWNTSCSHTPHRKWQASCSIGSCSPTIGIVTRQWYSSSSSLSFRPDPPLLLIRSLPSFSEKRYHGRPSQRGTQNMPEGSHVMILFPLSQSH
ncbi:hypothetical protein CC85DRAFT_67637 [Cutaneotrichosporon oleaginosum]|uniref:Uncharacterized protein n=1 Tax=Cutaneotrichosporon oleaginosum TaxID=879819 RepID=A0A0J1B5U9_9TREE|nr:uncharacterized protein CC85DRAFT_67637 [Cutaneotrichosporon oleaginosum]KLT43089.1 hypothetical protein CC85DRAFT_67637 [Cutaneotrichosporon oleaginosum]TXT10019.1 hypothetical protein COLE_03953 [Cutaneotrichosporon oleaginosum]